MRIIRFEQLLSDALRRVLLRSAAAGSLGLALTHCACPENRYDLRLVVVSEADVAFLRELEDTNELTLEHCVEHCLPSVEIDDEPTPLVACQTVYVGAEVLCEYSYVCEGAGRRPPGLASASIVEGADVVARWLADAAHLEAASVLAFEILGRELAHHGAPSRLRHAVAQAMRDEMVHARLFTELAKARGVTPESAVAASGGLRSLFDIALDNAAEGCVGETYGALAMAWMSHTALDPAVREVARVVAADEARHAHTSWQLDAWLRTRVDRRHIAAIDATRQARRERLAEELRGPTPEPLVRILGLLDSPSALALLDEILPVAA